MLCKDNIKWSFHQAMTVFTKHHFHDIFLDMDFHPLLFHLRSVQLPAGFALSLVIALISYRIKAISLSGALGMILVGTIIFGLGGMIFAIPLLFFYFTSIILTAVKTSRKSIALLIFDKSGPRDIWQVLVNGGVPAICAVIYFATGNIIWFFPALAALCEAAADTWATEVGTLSSSTPVSIVSLKTVNPGQSGGVTALGILAAVAGSVLTMLVAYWLGFLEKDLTHYSIRLWMAAANCGLAGSLLDSILGGSLQAQYRCEICNRVTEKTLHCGLPTTLERGYKFINNDVVNFSSSLFAAFAAAAIFVFGV
jgi:uncharacterized protein (TIGR00297 family)